MKNLFLSLSACLFFTGAALASNNVQPALDAVTTVKTEAKADVAPNQEEDITICNEISRKESTNPFSGVTTVTVTYLCTDYPTLGKGIVFINSQP